VNSVFFAFTLIWTIYLHRKNKQSGGEQVVGPTGVSGAEMGMAVQPHVETSQ
jgi:hypothetical protein